MSHLVVLRRLSTDVGFDLLTPNGFDRENGRGRERESTLTLFRAELPESGLKRVELLGIRRANKAVQCWVSRVDRDWNASNVVESERSSDLISF